MSSLKGLLRLFSPTGVWRNRAWLFCLGIAILPLPALRYLIQDQAELWIAWFVYVVPTSWGIGAAIAIRERLEAESTLLDRALTNARDRIAGIQSGEPNRELDGNTWESFVPKDQLIGKRVAMTTRMAQSLCNEAMANRIPPISTTAQAYASELGIGVRSLRTSQTVALRLGILVTFIGLIGAMREIGNLVLTSPDATDASLKAMGTDLTKAFGASVAGLLATLVIQAFVELVQISQRRAVGKVEVVVATVTHVLSLEQVGKAFRITIDKLGRRLEEHGQKLTDHVFAVRASTAEAVDAVNMNAEAFQKAAAEVGGDNQAMTDLLQRHHSLFEKLMASVDAVGAFERRLSGVIVEETARLEAGARTIGDTIGIALDRLATPLIDKADRQTAALVAAGDGLAAAARQLGEISMRPAPPAPGLGAELTERLAAALERFERRPRAGRLTGILASGFSLGLGLAIGAAGLAVMIQQGLVTIERLSAELVSTPPQNTTEQPK